MTDDQLYVTHKLSDLKDTASELTDAALTLAHARNPLTKAKLAEKFLPEMVSVLDGLVDINRQIHKRIIDLENTNGK